MAYRSSPPSDFRCGRYPAAWNPARKVHTVAASKRFEVSVSLLGSTIARNTSSPEDALRLARLFANTGSPVTVRDRSKRGLYLTETELQELIHA